MEAPTPRLKYFCFVTQCDCGLPVRIYKKAQFGPAVINGSEVRLRNISTEIMR